MATYHPHSQTISLTVYLPKEIDGVVVIVEKENDQWELTNDNIQSTAPGPAYRRSKSMEDKFDQHCPWGSMLEGIDNGDGWLQFQVLEDKENRIDPADGEAHTLEEMTEWYDGVYSEKELYAYFHDECKESFVPVLSTGRVSPEPEPSKESGVSRGIIIVTWPSAIDNVVRKFCKMPYISMIKEPDPNRWEKELVKHILKTAEEHKHITLVAVHVGPQSIEKARAAPTLLKDAEAELKKQEGCADVVIQWVYYYQADDFMKQMSTMTIEDGIILQKRSLLVFASIPVNTFDWVKDTCEQMSGLEYIEGFSGVVSDLRRFEDWQGLVRGYLETAVRTEDVHDITILGIAGGPCDDKKGDSIPHLLSSIQRNLNVQKKEEFTFKWRYYLSFDDVKADIDLWRHLPQEDPGGSFVVPARYARKTRAATVYEGGKKRRQGARDGLDFEEDEEDESSLKAIMAAATLAAEEEKAERKAIKEEQKREKEEQNQVIQQMQEEQKKLMEQMRGAMVQPPMGHSRTVPAHKGGDEDQETLGKTMSGPMARSSSAPVAPLPWGMNHKPSGRPWVVASPTKAHSMGTHFEVDDESRSAPIKSSKIWPCIMVGVVLLAAGVFGATQWDTLAAGAGVVTLKNTTTTTSTTSTSTTSTSTTSTSTTSTSTTSTVTSTTSTSTTTTSTTTTVTSTTSTTMPVCLVTTYLDKACKQQVREYFSEGPFTTSFKWNSKSSSQYVVAYSTRGVCHSVRLSDASGDTMTVRGNHECSVLPATLLPSAPFCVVTTYANSDCTSTLGRYANGPYTTGQTPRADSWEFGSDDVGYKAVAYVIEGKECNTVEFYEHKSGWTKFWNGNIESENADGVTPCTGFASALKADLGEIRITAPKSSERNVDMLITVIDPKMTFIA